MINQEFRYWLCESSLYDNKFELDYDTYEKICSDLIDEQKNHRLVKVAEITSDFHQGYLRNLYLYDYYIIVDKQTYSQYSEI